MSPSPPVPPPWAKRLKLGRLLYLGFHYPLAALARSRREGGPLQQWIDARGRAEMKQAVRLLAPWPKAPADSPEVFFLTGKRFWFQTAFCFWSLRQQAGRDLKLVLVDDGTIDSELRIECERIFPGSRVLSAAEMEAELDVSLPRDRFPSLRAQRQTYLHLRKLTDVHAGAKGWKLVLDSDMLFFRKPEALLSWLDSPPSPIHMLDVQNAYGYPAETLTQLAGQVLPERVNVGVLGLRSEAIDWAKLEHGCAELLRRHGTSYYLEQALSALLLSGTSRISLPADQYVLMPSEADCRAPRVVLHHYVAESKRGYFRHAWRHIR